MSIDIVGRQPHLLTEEQLKAQMLQEFPKFSKGQVDALFNSISLIQNRIIGFDSEGKAVLTNVVR